MEKSWITSPPVRSHRTVFTVVGSVVLHGSIIAVAALWPVHDPVPTRELPPTEIVDVFPPVEPAEATTPESNPALPPIEAAPPPVAEVSTDTPPPSEDPEIIEPTPPKPVVKTVESKTRLPHSPTTVTARGTQAQPGGATGPRSALGTAGAGHPGPVGRWNTPQPPYPYTMRAARVQGSGSVRITTDGSGRVASAIVVQSTGNALLDDNTVRFARTSWSGPPNASVTVPITYQMR